MIHGSGHQEEDWRIHSEERRQTPDSNLDSSNLDSNLSQARICDPQMVAARSVAPSLILVGFSMFRDNSRFMAFNKGSRNKTQVHAQSRPNHA